MKDKISIDDLFNEGIDQPTGVTESEGWTRMNKVLDKHLPVMKPHFTPKQLTRHVWHGIKSVSLNAAVLSASVGILAISGYLFYKTNQLSKKHTEKEISKSERLAQQSLPEKNTITQINEEENKNGNYPVTKNNDSPENTTESINQAQFSEKFSQKHELINNSPTTDKIAIKTNENQVRKTKNYPSNRLTHKLSEKTHFQFGLTKKPSNEVQKNENNDIVSNNEGKILTPVEQIDLRINSAMYTEGESKIGGSKKIGLDNIVKTSKAGIRLGIQGEKINTGFNKPCYYAGIYLTKNVSSRLDIQAEIDLAPQNANLHSSEKVIGTDGTVINDDAININRLNYIDIPILLKYKTNDFSIYGGTRFSGLANTHYTHTFYGNRPVNGIDEGTHTFNGIAPRTSVYNNGIAKYTGGLILGIEYRIGKGFFGEMRLNGGLRDLTKNGYAEDYNGILRKSSIDVGIGYSIF